MNRDEFQQAQQKGLEAMQAFNGFTHDPEYPGRSYGHLNYYCTVIMLKGFHPMNEEVLREAFDAALEVCAYYPDRHFPDIPKLPTGEVVGPDHIRLLEGWFLKAEEIVTTEDRPPVLTDYQQMLLEEIAGMNVLQTARQLCDRFRHNEALKRSEKTIGDDMGVLLGYRLIEYPQGERKGATVTKKGSALISRDKAETPPTTSD